jgi:hypothetical protein
MHIACASLITRRLSMGQTSVLLQEWAFMTRGSTASTSSNMTKGPSWLPAKQWSDIIWLDANVPSMQGIRQSLASDEGWLSWSQNPCPQNTPFPGGAQFHASNGRHTCLLLQHACQYHETECMLNIWPWSDLQNGSNERQVSGACCWSRYCTKSFC